MGKQEIHTYFYNEAPKGRDHLADLGVDGRIMLQ
jgi:hypothetical protein